MSDDSVITDLTMGNNEDIITVIMCNNGVIMVKKQAVMILIDQKCLFWRGNQAGMLPEQSHLILAP